MTRRWRTQAGFTITELLVAATIMLAVAGSVFTVLNPAHGIFSVQPEVADLQQRMRVAVDSLAKDLLMAGNGVHVGRASGPLVDYFAPIMPYRVGAAASDPALGVFYRPDAISVVYVPSTMAQSSLGQALAPNSQTVTLNAQPNCPPPTITELCGFTTKMRVLTFDRSGASDAMTVMAVQNPALLVRHSDSSSTAYDVGSSISEIVTHTYYLKTNPRAGTFQLMRYDGWETDFPMVDHVVKLEFAYFGEPQPPVLIPGKSLTDAVGPFTTYGPAPPPAEIDNTNDAWAAGENCIFQLRDGEHVPRLPVLAAGFGYVTLPQGVLTDGPWCVDDRHSNRFDADLLRIRRVQVTVRVQVAAASRRGPAGLLFTRGGTATSGYVPDHEATFDVTPRNMNLTR